MVNRDRDRTRAGPPEADPKSARETSACFIDVKSSTYARFSPSSSSFGVVKLKDNTSSPGGCVECRLISHHPMNGVINVRARGQFGYTKEVIHRQGIRASRNRAARAFPPESEAILRTA